MQKVYTSPRGAVYTFFFFPAGQQGRGGLK
jgi:hypothetical protein